MREEELLRIIRDTLSLSLKKEGVRVDIGDDGAIVEEGGIQWVFTCDLLEEGIHFKRDYFSPYYLGWKGVAVSVSDIYAMGGEPLYALVSLSMPSGEEEIVKEIYQGVRDFSQEFRVKVVGGNLSTSSGWKIDVFGVGKVESPILRRGAQKGDLIVVTGYPGEASGGRILLEKGVKGYEEIKKRFLKPYPRREILQIRRKFPLTSLIDVSDGVGRDLWRILIASEKGALLFPEKFPLSPELCEIFGEEAERLFWRGGEDYELIFTIPGSVKIPSHWQGLKLTVIGEITEEKGKIRTPQGILREEGFDHFV